MLAQKTRGYKFGSAHGRAGPTRAPYANIRQRPWNSSPTLVLNSPRRASELRRARRRPEHLVGQIGFEAVATALLSPPARRLPSSAYTGETTADVLPDDPRTHVRTLAHQICRMPEGPM